MNRIDALFARTRAEGRTALLPFLAAGDPDLATTAALIRGFVAESQRRDVPLLLEIGFPYSDPIADGSTIQAAYSRALDGGVRLDEIFAMLAELRETIDVPFVAMASYSLMFRRGPEVFLRQARSAGLDGVIVPDLPIEEAGSLREIAEQHDLRTIPLIAPTTPPERRTRISQVASGFIYFISVTGITGEREELPKEIADRVDNVRGKTDLPICVGFGVSKPEQVRWLSGFADGVIVGSAIVKRIGKLEPGDDAGIAEVSRFVGELLDPLAR